MTTRKRRSSWKPPADEKGFTIGKLEAILRHWVEFRELYKNHGVEEITLDDGMVVNIHDILRGVATLPPKQRQATYLTCVLGLSDSEAASIMGLKRWSSPVSTYRQYALQKLHKAWLAGHLDTP